MMLPVAYRNTGERYAPNVASTLPFHRGHSVGRRQLLDRFGYGGRPESARADHSD